MYRGPWQVADLMTVSPVVDVRGLRRRYGSDPPIDALVEVTFTVNPGEWVAVAGRSGSGKSTLLNILGCLDLQTVGTYLFEGIDVSSLSDRQRAGLRSRYIGFVYQAFHLLSHRTVMENVMLAEVYRRQPRAGRKERAFAALAKVGLAGRAEFLPTRLSGGEGQRVAIARALMGLPHLLLCDEPTGNLDSATAAGILDLVADLNADGTTIITITHDRDVAERAGRQLRMTDGVLVEAA
jgi:ABC-type lipoprotein export system ATPase subunit